METGFTTIRPKAAAANVAPALRVTHWMSKTVFTVPPSSKLIEAVDIMTEHRIRHVPVVDGERLVGIVSDRDVRNALPRRVEDWTPETASGGFLSKPVSEAMTRCPLTIAKDDGIHEAAEIMCREKIGALPVMDDGSLIGIISAEDLLWALMQITGERPPSA